MSDEIDVFNKFMVGGRGEAIVIMNPPRGEISKADALLLAAWLVALANDGEDQFAKIFDAVLNT